jgi:RNA polymerase sigma factor (sigma-70 family)
MSYAEFMRFRNFGKRTLQDLRELVKTVQRAHPGTIVQPTDRPPPGPVVADSFFIPPRAHALDPCDLPLSGRLESALQRKGIARLGELHGLPLREFRRLSNCGRRTIDELIRLLERVARGEFDAVQVEFSPAHCHEVLARLDQLLIRLPPRNQEILRLRLASEASHALTLEEIGAQFKLTRERVRQIAEKAIGFMRKEGGPGLGSQLRGIAAACCDRVMPLTPALLSRWLGRQALALKLPVVFYVRLLGELNPQIPAWSNGPEAAGNQKGLAGEVLAGLEEALLTATQGLAFKKAFELAQGRPKTRRLTVGDFLDVLRRARSVRVDLSKPDEPLIRLRRLRAADVSKAILERSPVPLLA